MTTIFDSINWTLLRSQKETLLYLADDVGMSTVQYDAIQGIINLLDEFQDTAVAEGYATEYEVFGKLDSEIATKPCDNGGCTGKLIWLRNAALMSDMVSTGVFRCDKCNMEQVTYKRVNQS